jgi:hypothetical protein
MMEKINVNQLYYSIETININYFIHILPINKNTKHIFAQ